MKYFAERYLSALADGGGPRMQLCKNHPQITQVSWTAVTANRPLPFEAPEDGRNGIILTYLFEARE